VKKFWVLSDFEFMELCFLLKEKKIVIFDTQAVEGKDVRILSTGVMFVLNPAVRIVFVFSFAHTKFF